MHLARRASLRPETISRAKRRGTIDLASIEALASAAGLRLTLEPAGQPGPDRIEYQSPLAHPKFGLAWSNPGAGAAALVVSALRNGNYMLLLEAATAHGLDFVRQQLGAIAPTLKPSTRSELVRKLGSIEKGFARAQARDAITVG